jgi:hypothetical protein
MKYALLMTLTAESLCFCAVLSPSPTAVNRVTVQVSRPQSLTDLRVIGEGVAQAVLRKDAAALLAYDALEFKAENEQSLNDPKSDLYCFLFDTTCNNGPPSILQILSTAKKMTVTVKDLGIGSDGYRYAAVFFYDAAVIPQRQLNSQRVLCREGGRRIASWVFRIQSGRWIGANEPFDFETDTLCQPR